MKRSKSCFSLHELYPFVFQQEAISLESEIEKILISKQRINKRYIGCLICGGIGAIILIIFLGLSLIGIVVAVLFAFCLFHILKKAWRKYKLNKHFLSKEYKYETRLSCLNLYLKTLKKSTISVKDFQGLLEKIFEEFLPAIVLQLFNIKLEKEVKTLLLYLKSDTIHSCLLNSAIQLEFSITHNQDPAIIAARLRKFFIPIMYLLKQPKEKENQELEIVRRIGHILLKEETQLILLTYKMHNDILLRSVTPFWSLVEYNKSTQSACNFIVDVENNFSSNKNKLSTKQVFYRRNSFDDSLKLGKPAKAAKKQKKQIFSIFSKTFNTFAGIVNLSESIIEDQKSEITKAHIIRQQTNYFNDLDRDFMPGIIRKSAPMMFEGDMAELNQSSESNQLIEESKEIITEKKDTNELEENSIIIKFSEENSKSKENPLIVHPFLDCFEQLLAIEREPHSDKIWKIVVNKPETKVYQRKVIDSPICMIKAFCDVNYSAKTVYTAIWDTSIRRQWDAVFNEFRLIEQCRDYEVLYYMIKTPFGITKRDWLQRRVEIHDYPENGTIILHFASMEHPDMPPKKNVIRAETLISGYVIRPTGENSCHVMIVSQNDIKGLIPKAIVNRVASKAPADWVNSMNKGCRIVAGY